MAKTATVKDWRGRVGFVAVEGEEKLVRVRREDIDGGRLRVGLDITFDVVAEEGQPPRVTNVSGKGLLAKDAKLTDEELEEDKKRLKEIKAQEKERLANEFDEAWKEIEKLRPIQQKRILAKLTEEFEIGKEERRPDPTEKNGELYTRGEFIAFYGKAEGEKKWAAAPASAKKRRSKPGSKPAPERTIVRE